MVVERISWLQLHVMAADTNRMLETCLEWGNEGVKEGVKEEGLVTVSELKVS